MKKIMFYSKNSKRNITILLNELRTNSSIFVLVTAFFCGTITGSTFAINSEKISDFDLIFKPIITANIKDYLIWGMLFSLIMFIFSVLGGLSCFGSIVQITIQFLCGIYCSGIICYYIIMFSFQGLIKASISILPGTSLIISSLISAGNCGNKISSLIANNVFYQGGDRIEFKEYLIKVFFCYAASLVGILTNAALIWVVSGI